MDFVVEPWKIISCYVPPLHTSLYQRWRHTLNKKKGQQKQWIGKNTKASPISQGHATPVIQMLQKQKQ